MRSAIDHRRRPPQRRTSHYVINAAILATVILLILCVFLPIMTLIVIRAFIFWAHVFGWTG